MSAIKRGDICGMRTLRRIMYANFRASDLYEEWELVKCSASTRDGTLKEFIPYPGSYSHKKKHESGKPVFYAISEPENQTAARKLWDQKNLDGPRYENAEGLKKAILSA